MEETEEKNCVGDDPFSTETHVWALEPVNYITLHGNGASQL